MKVVSNIIYFLAAIVLILYIFFEEYLPINLTKSLAKVIIFWSSFISIITIELIKRKK